jgi:glycosyltransferase involved in cell wall biosynthesis
MADTRPARDVSDLAGGTENPGVRIDRAGPGRERLGSVVDGCSPGAPDLLALPRDLADSERIEPQAPPPSVSFVVIAHNEAANIERTLRSILAQETAGEREVIVVDDGSTDATAEVVIELARSAPGIRLQRLAHNRGRGFARSSGIAQASGRYIATVDADIVLPPGWLSCCLEALAGADAVAGTAVPDGDVAFLHSRYRLEPKLVAHATEVTGSNAVYRREVFERVSFDPTLRNGEDVALNRRLREQRARMLTIPGLTVRHEESKTFAQSLRWLYQSGRGATRQLYRDRTARRPDLAFAGWLLVWAGAFAAARRARSSMALPALYTGVVAAAHVSRAFVATPRRRFLAAVATDMALLSAYFGGRTVGLWSERPR